MSYLDPAVVLVLGFFLGLGFRASLFLLQDPGQKVRGPERTCIEGYAWVLTGSYPGSRG